MIFVVFGVDFWQCLKCAPFVDMECVDWQSFNEVRIDVCGSVWHCVLVRFVRSLRRFRAERKRVHGVDCG